MPVISELTQVSILTFLAEKYPSYVEGKDIAKILGGKGRFRDVERCLHYLYDKNYITIPGPGILPPTDVIEHSWRLTAKGVDYLECYNRELGEMLKEIKRKEAGFRV